MTSASWGRRSGGCWWIFRGWRGGGGYRFCADPAAAHEVAKEFEPTVILQDLIMPGVDGIEMVREFRGNPATANTPLIVLSSKEEPTTKAEAFAAGANDYLVKLPDKLEVVARIRYHSAAYISRLERDEAFTVLEAAQNALKQELAEASNYAQSLLPAPMPEGSLVPARWKFVPSSSLGGDSFGYHWMSDTQLAIYLLDVCGHGVGAALLSVSAINTIRNGGLPNVDFEVPSQVLAGLNQAFPMEKHGGKYFTMFYGVYDITTREIVFSSAGHPPPIVIGADGAVSYLSVTGMIIGALPFATYTDRRETLAAGSRLYVFSDGCYEVWNEDQSEMMTAVDFAGVLAEAAKHADALERAVAASQGYQKRAEFEDDFSLVEFRL